MKAIYIALLVILLAGGAFFGVNFFSKPNESVAPTKETSTQNEPILDTPAFDNEVVVQSPEELKQQQIENGKKLMNSAVITSNPLLCEQIAIPDLKQACLDQASLSLALTENDPLVCDTLTEPGAGECRDQVNYQLAQQSGKLEDCKKIIRADIIEKCTQEIELKSIKKQVVESGNDTKKLDCESYTNEIAKEQCLADKRLLGDQGQLKDAIENQSSASCEPISDTLLKQECYDAVYFSRAKSSQKVEVCENIVNTDTKDHCKITIADFSDASIFEKAIIEQSTKLCEKINLEGMRKSCIDRIRINEIIKSGNREACTTLSDASLRKNCETSF